MSWRLKFSVAVMALLGLLGGSYFIYMEEWGNFHPITDGEAHRSAILGRDELEYYIEKYRIKSIVNLLGDHPNKLWYREEIKVCAEHNVKHYDVSLPVYHEPTEEDIRKLVEILKNVPRLVLIHYGGN
jgi:hypothetical protein